MGYRRAASSQGVGLYRDLSGNLVVVRGQKTLNEIEDFENPESGLDSDRSVFCAGLASTSGGTTVARGGGFEGSNSSSTPVVDSSQGSVEEVSICGPGIVVAMVDGYYLFYLEPNVEESAIPYYRYLGDNTAHDCIKDLIGVVKCISSEGYMSLRQSKWAFKDRQRVFMRRVSYDLQKIQPMLPPFNGDGDQSWSLLEVGWYVPHYGSPFYPSMGVAGSCANIGGAGEQFTFTRWGRDFYLWADIEEDFFEFDTQGVNVGAFYTPSVRVQPVQVGVSCEDDYDPSSAVDANILLLGLVNRDRVCGGLVDALRENVELKDLADYYAARMAEYDFIAHVDVEDGSTFEQRLDTFGVERTESVEVLAVVTGDVLDWRKACLDLFDAWKASEDHYNGLMGAFYYSAYFSIDYNADSGRWYGIGVLISTANDDLFETTSKVVLPKPSNYVFSGRFDDSDDWVVESRYYAYRSFNTTPTDDLMLSCLMFDTIRTSGYVPGGVYAELQVRNSDEYGVMDSEVIKGPVGPARAVESADPVVEYPDIWTYGGGQKRRVFSAGIYNYVDYYIEYASYSFVEDIFIRLYDVKPSEGEAFELDGEQDLRTFSRLYKKGDPLPGGGTWTDIDPEVEPELLGDIGGDSELFIGGSLVHNASDSGSKGMYNPFQTIVVAATYKAVSGFKAVVYTRTKCLNTTAVYWNTEEEDEITLSKLVQERYWWLKQSLWGAVLDPSNNVVARFPIKATLPPDDLEVYGYNQWEHVVTQPDEPDVLQTFYVQANGRIDMGSVMIVASVQGYDIVLVDDEQGGLFEEEYQHPDHQVVVASAAIDYNEGTLTLGFSSVKPLPGEVLTFTARTWPFSTLLSPIELFTEFVSYSSDTNYYHVSGMIDQYGYSVMMPNVSVTEDGRYLVIGMRVGFAQAERQERLSLGEYIKDFHTVAEGRTVIGARVSYKDSPHQVLVYDLQDMAGFEPKIVAPPFLISRLKRPTETLVLD